MKRLKIVRSIRLIRCWNYNLFNQLNLWYLNQFIIHSFLCFSGFSTFVFSVQVSVVLHWGFAKSPWSVCGVHDAKVRQWRSGLRIKEHFFIIIARERSEYSLAVILIICQNRFLVCKKCHYNSELETECEKSFWPFWPWPFWPHTPACWLWPVEECYL